MESEEKHVGLWAVVITAGGRYLGCIPGDYEQVMEIWTNEGIITVGPPVYEFNISMIPGPSPDGRGMVMQRNVSAFPLGLSLQPQKIQCKPTDIWFLDDMKTSDATKYKDLAVKASKMADDTRLKESGIVRPGTPEMPQLGSRGGGPPGGFVGR